MLQSSWQMVTHMYAVFDFPLFFPLQCGDQKACYQFHNRGCSSMMMAFSLLARTLGEVWQIIAILCLFGCFFVSFLVKWRLAHAHQFHFLGQDQSIVAQQAEMIVAECSLMSCRWGCFPGRFPHYAWTAVSTYSDFVGSRMYTCFGVICHLQFRKNDRGL